MNTSDGEWCCIRDERNKKERKLKRKGERSRNRCVTHGTLFNEKMI